MKYFIAVITIVVPAIIVLLSGFHLLILPYVAPHGFMPMMCITIVFGLIVGGYAEYLTDRFYFYLREKFS